MSSFIVQGDGEYLLTTEYPEDFGYTSLHMEVIRFEGAPSLLFSQILIIQEFDS